MTDTLTTEDLNSARMIALARIARVKDIAGEVSEASGVRKAAILGRSRRINACRARNLVMFIASREGIPNRTIAVALGCTDSSVSWGIKQERQRREGAAQ